MKPMHRKTIKAHLKKKLDAVADSIDDNKEIRTLFRKEACVLGGSIASMLMGDEINDYDIYFKTQEGAFKILSYFLERRNASIAKGVNLRAYYTSIVNCKGVDESRIVISNHKGIEGLEDRFLLARSGKAEREKNYGVRAITNNAISLSDKVQLIFRFTGDYERIIENFDYIHAQCMYDLKADALHLPINALESMMSKRLVYTGSLYPVASIIRMRKFIRRGWHISVGQILKMVIQVNRLNLADRITLIEQIMGVDLLYIQNFMVELDKAMSESTETIHDWSGLVENLLNKTFGDFDDDDIEEGLEALSKGPDDHIETY